MRDYSPIDPITFQESSLELEWEGIDMGKRDEERRAGTR